jgi:hypothetical protein
MSGLPSNWDCNHSAKAIEVVNEKLVPIFQIYYKNDTYLDRVHFSGPVHELVLGHG